jgi:hypothetical protein
LSRQGRAERVSGTLEDDEERVSLRAHLVAPVRDDGFADQVVVGREHVGVGLAQRAK